MKVLAVTGGIGSGKSFITQIFAAMGVPVYDADSRTKLLYDTDAELKSALVELFSDEILAQDGRIDRKRLASIVFNDAAALTRLEQRVFPAVLKDIDRWVDECSRRDSSSGFVVVESAIITEKEIFEGVADRILTVTSPLEIRISRVLSRDKTDRESVMARINSQCSDESRVKKSHFVIISDCERAVLPQVVTIFNEMNNL